MRVTAHNLLLVKLGVSPLKNNMQRFPFNEGSGIKYAEEALLRIAYKNEARLAWLRKQIEGVDDGK
jgi:hypothetical protein